MQAQDAPDREVIGPEAEAAIEDSRAIAGR